MRLTCWQNRGASLYELLVHHLKVAAGAKCLVHGPPVERRLQERLARCHALKGVFDGLPVVVCQLPSTASLHDIGRKSGDEVQVRPRIPARRFFPPFKISCGAATIFGRAGSGATGQTG